MNLSNLSNRTLVVAASLLGASTLALAQPATVRYNEAVRIVDGKRVVELPPVNKWDKPEPFKFGSQTRYGVETVNGLMDCSVAYYASEGCVPTTLGQVVAKRLYVVKVKGVWQLCGSREVHRNCLVLGKFTTVPATNAFE